MSIKEEGYLHDYIAAGLIGFAVGMSVTVMLWQHVFTTLMAIGWGLGITVTPNWGVVIPLGMVAGIFGFLPGGFVAGYLNFRIHRTEGTATEGLTAGIVASIVNFFITLFLAVAMAATYSAGAEAIMAGWGVSYVLWGFVFYPLGGYLAGMFEARPIPMPAIMKFQMAPSAPPPPPAAPSEKAPTCPDCDGPLTYIPQYQRWYCYKCKKYT
jgi:hypothetical protein